MAAPLGCAGDPGADMAAIEDLVQQEAQAMIAEDLQHLSTIWSEKPDILLFDVPPPGRFQGWEQVGRVFRDFFDRFSEIELTVKNLQVMVDGDLGYATYDWVLRGKMGDALLNDRGQATSIYHREEEGWRLVHAHYSPVPAAIALEAGESPPGAARP